MWGRRSRVRVRPAYERLLLLGNRVGRVDLDDVAPGPPELDLGSLVAHVELFEVRAGADVKPGLADLLAAYSSIGPSDVDLLERRRHKPLPRLGLAVVTVEPVESSTSWLLKVAGA